MKRVTVTSEYVEADIRPPNLLSEFRRLSIENAQTYFSGRSKMVEVPNPATGGLDSEFAFEKDGFRYNLAHDCGSLFVSPRPTRDALEDYYRTSEASAYQVEHYTKETAEARRYHLLRSLAIWMGRLFDEYGTCKAPSYVDIGTASPAIFDEIAELDLFHDLYSLNPLPGLEGEFEERGVKIIHEPIVDVGVVSAFQQIEKQFSPLELVKSAGDMLAVGGLFFMTTRTCSGFDLQVLWDKTPYIFVPEHLNLLSVEGLRALIDRAGLDTVEFSTPGQLDLELVQHAAGDDPSIELPRFVRYLIEERNEDAHADFREFLQKHRLSSHVRLSAARRRGEAV